MKRKLIAMGLATVLTVPSWIMAAHPMDASAKQAAVSKKTKTVITKIKAINNKKANYIKTTQAAQTAYKKLSAKDKKKVTNYKVLQKHVKAITPIITKVNKLKKDVAAVNSKNYKTKIAKLSSTYALLNTAGKAYVPTATVTKLNSYVNLNKASTSMKKITTLAATASSDKNFITGDEAIELTDGVAILNFITAYEKLSDNQKRLLGGSQYAINVLLAIKPIVKQAVAYDTKYNKLNQSNSDYLKQAYELMTNYEIKKGNEEAIEVVYDDMGSTETLTVAKYTKNDAELMGLSTKLVDALAVKKEFEDAVNNLPGDADSTSTEQLELVKEAVVAYKTANINIKDAKGVIGKPIDIVDKKILAEYKKYETIPLIIEALEKADYYDSDLDTYLKSPVLDFESEEIEYMNEQGLISSDKKLNELDTVVKNYLKLGADQKSIVDKALDKTDQIKYIADAASIKKGQSVSKAYTDGLAKNDLAAMKKALTSYIDLVKKNDRAMRYVVQAPAMMKLADTYVDQFGNVEDFELAMNEYTDLAGIKKAIKLYQVVEKDKPSGVKLIDTQIAKDYAITKTVVDLNKLNPKVETGKTYSTKKLNDILAAVKLYKKLSARDKAIVDGLYNKLADYSNEEKEIKEAMKIDTKYLALKPSTKAYNKNAKLVYNAYIDANEIVNPYIVYKEKINALANNYSNSQKTVDDFEILVNKYYSERESAVTEQATINNIKKLKNNYEHNIMPYQSRLDLLEPAALKKYNEIVPLVDVYNKIFMLKIKPETAVDRDAILTAIKAYEKLKPLDKQFIQVDATKKIEENRVLLNDKEIITKAQKIDSKYYALANKLPLNKAGIYDVYVEYMQAAADVKTYVMTAKQLEEANISYTKMLDFAKEFTSSVEKMNSNNKLVDMQILRGKYNDFKRLNSEIDQFITKATFKRYDMLLEVLTIQSAAKFIQTTKKGAAYENWLYEFNNVENGSSMTTIRKALLLFGGFNSVQHAILRNSPANSDEQRERNFDYEEWANQAQVGYLTDAINLEKRYKALSPTSKNYARQAMKIADELDAKGKSVQKYFLYNVELGKLKKSYEKSISNADAFEAAVRAYKLEEGIKGMSAMKTAYSKFELDPVALNNTDSSLVKKYKEYILAEEADSVFKTLLPEGDKSMENNEKLIVFIGKYNKLSADAKTVFKSENTDEWVDVLIKAEKEIKAAMAVDKKFLALDKSKKTYEADVLKVYNEYQKLTDLAKIDYFVNQDELEALYASYSDPTVVAKEFTNIVNLLTAESPYNSDSDVPEDYEGGTVEDAYELYKDLSVPKDYLNAKNVTALNFVDKAVVTKYNQYAPLVTIKQSLDRAKYEDYTDEAKFTITQRSGISDAIALYNKLAKDPRSLFNNDIAFGEFGEEVDEPLNQPRYLMNSAADIKAAIAVEEKFKKIKQGDKSYVKNVVDALSSYNSLVNYSVEDGTGELLKDEFPKRFFTETNLYNLYNKKYPEATSFNGAVDTVPEAILAIQNFKNKINEVQTLHDYINQLDPEDDLGEVDYQDLLDAMVEADEYYKFVNRLYTIDGEKIQLMGLVEAKYKTDYNYFMAVYKVNEYLKGLK